MREGRAAESDVKQAVELDVPRKVPSPGDESLVFYPAHAPADVGRHGNYNNSSLGSHSESPTNSEASP
jgi:hypothetical protein